MEIRLPLSTIGDAACPVADRVAVDGGDAITRGAQFDEHRGVARGARSVSKPRVGESQTEVITDLLAPALHYRAA